ncbi:MAG: adenosylcobinamide-GDP ribazoletransferase, partial [Siculibacillus sp.]|nr:adenosylcobinamide-GDP ribazoletransferase [Siculibacillus sp.]
ADVADGFGGGATIERRLAIMKDSCIGAFAGVALVAQFVLRAGMLAEVLERADGMGAAVVVLAVAAIARVAPLFLMVALPPARPDGLGRSAGRPEATALGFAAAGALAVAAVGLVPLAGAVGFGLALGLAAVSVAGLGALARTKIGGFTGDVIGAGTVVAEIAALIGLLA